MKNLNGSFLKGFLIGILCPFLGVGIAFGILTTLGDYQFGEAAGYTASFRWRTICLIGLLFNLLPFHFFLKKGEYNTIRGIIIPTVIFAISWFLIYQRDIFSAF